MRRKLLLRGMRAKRALRVVQDRTKSYKPDAILLFCVFRNEYARLPYFLRYYRELGVDHFLFIDNGSDDQGGDFLAAQPDVSLWRADGSYKDAGYGIDWINALLGTYGNKHWCLTVDADEFFVFPFCDTRPLRAFADALTSFGMKSCGGMLLDMYPQGPVGAGAYVPGDDPFRLLTHFDSGNYTMRRNQRFGQLWIQGGPRMRHFFKDDPGASPALNKIPFVRWEREFVYASSTHMLLPRGLNRVYASDGGEYISGCLLHAKFLPSFVDKAHEEVQRREHYADSAEYIAYQSGLGRGLDFSCAHSTPYRDWRQLEMLGLMSSGGWA